MMTILTYWTLAAIVTFLTCFAEDFFYNIACHNLKTLDGWIDFFVDFGLFIVLVFLFWWAAVICKVCDAYYDVYRDNDSF